MSDTLPLEGSPTLADGTWSIRLPVRAEHVTTSKQTVVRERVRIVRRRVEDIAHVEAKLRREELRTTRT
jgi:uncharacterized protein (TIGR02271 family)